MGEIINEYELLEPFQNQNAGFSRWTYAKRKGKTYFLKEFMDPIYPDGDTLSESLREMRISDCGEFEKQKRSVYKAINGASDGNVIRIFEFFRYDSHYYVACPKVEGENISFGELAKLPLEDKVLLCRTIAHGVMKLHQAGIVHSDIKDTNVLVHRSATGKYVAKLIDFDSAFFETCPPELADDLEGDQVYLSPEACQFICGDPVALNCKMDVFSLGLLFHQYLTGYLPSFDPEDYGYAHEAVLDEQVLGISEDLPERLRLLLHQMLLAEPEDRWDIAEVYAVLGEFIRQKARLELPPTDPHKADPQTQKDPWFKAAGDL